MMKNRKPWFLFVIVFILLNIFFITNHSWLEKKGIDQEVLIGGNLVVFIATVLSFFIYVRSMNAVNPTASVRGMYSSFIIKFFFCLIAAFIYILAARKNVNKPALMISMVLYILYTAIEVSTLQKLLIQKKNA